MQLPSVTDADWLTPAASGAVDASVRLPGSKSITNRALVLAALADAPTVIEGPLTARDTELMAGALAALGAGVEREAPATAAGPARWTVTPGWRSGDITVSVGNAGTVLRFVPPVAALAAADIRFVGDPRVSERPVGELLGALRQAGVEIADEGRGAIPFVVRGAGRVPGGEVRLDASSSSQLVSGLMLAAPRYEQGLRIRHQGGRVPSAPHIAMSAAMLAAAGAVVVCGTTGALGSAGPQVPDYWEVRPGRLSLGTIMIEPDLSNAAPFLAAALVTGGRITFPGWPADSLQAADQIMAVLGEMGASFRPTAAGMQVEGTGKIHGIQADLRDINELAPVLTALAALADSPSELTGIGHMRMHESDRLAVLAAEISALGGHVTELADGLRILPRPLAVPADPFDSHDDHRMVMAAAVLGLAVPGLRVRNAATVGKTFPEFTRQWRQMLEPAS